MSTPNQTSRGAACVLPLTGAKGIELVDMLQLPRIIVCIALVLATATPRPAIAADEWEQIAQRDGILVSRKYTQGHRYPRVRAVGEVAGTPYEVLAILQDVPAQVAWRPDCVESSLVRDTDTWRNVVYTRIDLPWPVADREVVVQNEVAFLHPPTKLKVTFTSVPADEVARRRGTVRMVRVEGFYEVEAIDDARSQVHYEVDADPGGSVPEWLVTMQSTRNPLETLAGLRARLQETRGQYAAQIASFPRAD